MHPTGTKVKKVIETNIEYRCLHLECYTQSYRNTLLQHVMKQREGLSSQKQRRQVLPSVLLVVKNFTFWDKGIL